MRLIGSYETTVLTRSSPKERGNPKLTSPTNRRL
jgi:hypothetical protein